MDRTRCSRPLMVVLAGVVLSTVLAGPLAAAAGAVDDDMALRHRRSSLRADLVSRSFDAPSGSWRIVVEATLDSRALCLPAIFDCIVEPEVAPDGATLESVACPGPLWNHLWIFTDRCLKQLFTAGHDQRFRMTYRTDAASAPASVDIGVRFGRGLFPVVIQELASTSLTVDLTATLDLAQTCSPDVVPAGSPLQCTTTVTHADPGDSPPAVDVAELTVAPDPAALVAGPTLAAQGAAGDAWTCSAGVCSLDPGGEIPAGASVQFLWSATAADSQDGGDLLVSSDLAYGVGAPDRTASASADVTVAGAADTELDVTKSAVTPRARPGDRVEWTVTVDNSGGPGDPGDIDARSVVLTDAPSPVLEGLTLTYVSGVGEWSCAARTCSAASMPTGRATFLAAGTLSSSIPPGIRVVNQVDVTWANDVHGPDFPAVAGASIEVEAPPAPAPAPSPAPAPAPRSLAFTG